MHRDEIAKAVAEKLPGSAVGTCIPDAIMAAVDGLLEIIKGTQHSPELVRHPEADWEAAKADVAFLERLQQRPWMTDNSWRLPALRVIAAHSNSIRKPLIEQIALLEYQRQEAEQQAKRMREAIAGLPTMYPPSGPIVVGSAAIAACHEAAKEDRP
jgi:hypothetical protein